MASFDNTTLVKTAEQFLAAAKGFNGDPNERMKLVKQANNLRIQSEDGFGSILRQWDQVWQDERYLTPRQQGKVN